MSVRITGLTAEHHHDGFGLCVSSPRLSWRYEASSIKGWCQTSCEISIHRQTGEETYTVESSESVLVPWPSTPLSSREIATVQVFARGSDGSITNRTSLTVEAALFDRSEWQAKLISGPAQPEDAPKKPFRLRTSFKSSPGKARLYATAYGIYQVEINGRVVGDHVLSPGWQSYHHRLHYQVFDVSDLIKKGENVIGAYIGEGWYSGRLGRPGTSNIWGSRPAFLCQLEVEGQFVCGTDQAWEYLDGGPVVHSEIYNGETFDTHLDDPSWSQATGNGARAEELPFPAAELSVSEAPPVRRIMELKAVEVITTPSGKTVLDFGQNLVGWIRIDSDIPGQGDIIIRHAEVMEHGELGVRPLRTAKATATIKLGGRSIKGFEPRFSWYGFRYVEISGIDTINASDFTAVVISSDLRRTGTFNCSHQMINKLHENTVWSMRGNFVSVPTDCPQRDERLGWTGDLQVFAPTANYLFDTTAFLSSWLRDLEADQRDLNGVVPTIIPAIPIPSRYPERRPMAIWADAAVLTPWDLYTASGDDKILETQWESMRLWLDKGVPRNADGFYTMDTPQYGDWLDPRAPPMLPGHSPTDPYLIANAYLIYVTSMVGKIGAIIGKSEADGYTREAKRLRDLYREEYISATGRLASDTQAAYAVALHCGMFEGEREVETARKRLNWMVRWEAFKINTGFAGTPIILDILAKNDMLHLAYRMLQEPECPSWLYPVSMGATTIWERWNSMLPDGTINPGQMTSFNHYALGSVCAFLHQTIGGLSPGSPGWRTALVRPRPGGTIRHASTSFDSRYGKYSARWVIEDSLLKVDVTVPPNTNAKVDLPGLETVVESGEHYFEVVWTEDSRWPPAAIQGAQGQSMPDEFIS